MSSHTLFEFLRLRLAILLPQGALIKAMDRVNKNLTKKEEEKNQLCVV